MMSRIHCCLIASGGHGSMWMGCCLLDNQIRVTDRETEMGSIKESFDLGREMWCKE